MKQSKQVSLDSLRMQRLGGLPHTQTWAAIFHPGRGIQRAQELMDGQDMPECISEQIELLLERSE